MRTEGLLDTSRQARFFGRLILLCPKDRRVTSRLILLSLSVLDSLPKTE